MARPRAAAGALFFDEMGRVLLVEPSYKPGWDIPGGFLEPGESPYTACMREVREEIGISPPIGPLLVVDWASEEPLGDMLLFVFDGGLLPASWRDRIRLDMDEIVDCAFTPVSEVDGLLPLLHARRVKAAAGLRGSVRSVRCVGGVGGVGGAVGSGVGGAVGSGVGGGYLEWGLRVPDQGR